MDHDKEFERAIALSLQESTTTANNPIVISDDEDEDTHFQADLKRAIAASKAEGFRDTNTRPQSFTPSAFLSERAQLEKERLERQKRLRQDAGFEDENTAPPAKRQHISSSSRVSTNRRADTSVSASSSSSTSVFWEGELRPVANRHTDPRQDGKPTFRLTEVLGKKSEISFAILSSYSLSVSWIYEFFDPSVPVIIVAQPDESGQATIKNVLPNWIRTTPFLRYGRGCMHMKFMLLFYKTGRLRVVISTANLIDYDYRDIENAIWLQDVPLRPQPLPNDPKAVDNFATVMQRVLHALNVRPALATHLKTDHPNLPLQSIDHLRSHWDWSKVKVKLVPSIAGKHEGWPKVILTGHTRLMKAIRDMGLRTGKGKAAKDLVIECQGSSIGTYSTQWMNEFHWSARGESAEDWLDEPKTRRAKLPYPAVKIVFPSLKTVQTSVLGEPGGGTMFCRGVQWNGAKFPRQLFHDSNSTAGGVLMHTKMIIGTFKQKATTNSLDSHDKGKGRQSDADSDTETETEEDDVVEVVNDAPIGWAYLGSHNFTPSAWGTLSGSGFNPILNVVNYELGIVFPLQDESELESVSCFKRPPRKYKVGEDKPWMQEESTVFQR
ncbi:hypothetical protein SERLA73DRAFT_171190 [Serpula lacrymans var. lacrymans S7.3]|uniref:Phospholipase D/nuclease n=1 Tax=Serpula lacrymans var. lacrymans (strain S7.3) TaxID=936435 RepID=F8QAJ0_SERL3|nr:hypothetical protein SERLA73DRAFT_171190 [Serpula lacrymans var. lacrymans S7.3]